MFKKIFVAADNSAFSEACCTAAVSLAQAFGGEVVGGHVYAARMHERRFRQMEAALPEEYLVDKELERQRAIHDSLIALGLQLISESYLDSLEKRCQAAEVPFARKTFEGKNWERLVEDINGSSYDLVVLGARGHGTTRPDSIGSVGLRVLRRTKTDTLVIKEPEAFLDGAGRDILVALDGSKESFGALQAALALGKAYHRPVNAVAAYDPYFHYAVFHSMVKALSEEAARVFRFEEQERLHEEIIDTGLARLYQTHLDVAQRVADAEGVPLTTTLLAGRAAEEVMAYAEKVHPWLLLLGRIGVHSREEMDIGSVTEHLLRFASCNLLVASRRFAPPLDLWSASTARWTEEAEAVLRHAPQEYQGALRLMVQRLALEKGHTVVTASLVGEAMEALRPSREDTKRMGEAALSVALEALRKEPAPVYLCPQCGHAARGQRPVACPACRQDGQAFLIVDVEALEAAAKAQGGVEKGETFDGSTLRWSRAALQILQRVSDPYERNRARLRIEKAARLAKLPVITLEFALSHLPEARQTKDISQPTSPRIPGTGDVE
ncbi:MAG: universal stress protein [Chloroflexi bacterium]|nr:universal stress protein [Chloroflexota bacterium]